MQTDTLYLFIYGTLLNADNEYGRYLKIHSTYVSPGHFNGTLYDLGEYPGAFYRPDLNSKVYGDIVLLDKPFIFKKLDEYEGYGEGQPEPWLYTREIVPVYTAEGVIDCWVYLYNLSVETFPQIPSGRYQ